jgi:hypothetical protein
MAAFMAATFVAFALYGLSAAAVRDHAIARRLRREHGAMIFEPSAASEPPPAGRA